MISPECFTPGWIAAKSAELQYPDRNIIEKVIRAFALLDLLAASGCPFHFKGGSCLMLLLNEHTRRASIDIDIICPPGTEIEQYLTSYRDYGFTKYESVERVQRGTDIPKTHSKFFYRVGFKDDADATGHILLDVLNEDCHYVKTETLPIASPFIKMTGEAGKVRVPSVGDMLGDKLTAFAPNTSGIPYFKNGRDCSLEIIKQLYDVGRLFDKVEDLETTATAFKRIAGVELSYRDLPDDPALITDDIRQTALCLATRGKEGLGDFTLLQKGINSIKSFMFQGRYVIEHAIVDAAKAAYAATALEKGELHPVKYNGEPMSIAGLELFPSVTTRLNKLRRSLPEAYFYWAQTSRLLQLHSMT